MKVMIIITNQYLSKVLLKIITNTMKAEEIKTKNISKAIFLRDYAIFK